MSAQTGSQQATITVTSKNEPWGQIVLRFFPDVAPNHVKNFVDLAKKGFYNGTTFHRVIPRIHDSRRGSQQQECGSWIPRHGRTRLPRECRVQQ